jgi:transketolase
LDKKTILKSAKKTKKVIVIQDHQISGGLGSAVSELLGKELPTKMNIIGVKDTFAESGSTEELWRKYQIDNQAIFNEIKKILR